MVLLGFSSFGGDFVYSDKMRLMRRVFLFLIDRANIDVHKSTNNMLKPD